MGRGGARRATQASCRNNARDGRVSDTQRAGTIDHGARAAWSGTVARPATSAAAERDWCRLTRFGPMARSGTAPLTAAVRGAMHHGDCLLKVRRLSASPPPAPDLPSRFACVVH